MASRTRVKADDDDTNPDLLGNLRRKAARDFFLVQHRWARVLLMSRDLSGAQCRVALALLQHTNLKKFDRDGFLEAWPSQLNIGRLIGQTERAVWTSISQLRKAGVIKARRKGKGYAYTFRLSWREKTEDALGPLLDEWPDGMLKNATVSGRKLPE